MPKLLEPEAFYEKARDEAVSTSCRPFVLFVVAGRSQFVNRLFKAEVAILVAELPLKHLRKWQQAKKLVTKLPPKRYKTWRLLLRPTHCQLSCVACPALQAKP